MSPRSSNQSRWDALYELAGGQGGYFSTHQAKAISFSSQLLRSHVVSGALVHERRGVYRLTRFPPSENEDLVVLWLWSQQEGVFSHDTALSLYQLSEALPTRYHITVPEAWRKKRRRAALPRNVVLHHADLPARDRTWMGLVPVTTALRTLHDLVEDQADPTIVQQAAREGIARALFRQQEVRGLVPPRRGRPPGAVTTSARRKRQS